MARTPSRKPSAVSMIKLTGDQIEPASLIDLQILLSFETHRIRGRLMMLGVGKYRFTHLRKEWQIAHRS